MNFKHMAIVGVIVLGAALSGVAADSDENLRAGTTGFQSDLSALRGKIIPMCAQLQIGKPAEDNTKLLADINAIIAVWKDLAAKYKGNPPVEYAHDASWNSYLEEVLDNFNLMRVRAEQNNYRRAMQFCGMNCGVFVTMNQVSGIDKASDKMFMVRKNAKLMMEMAKADNWKGAEHVREHTKEMVAAMIKSAAPMGVDSKVFKKDMQAVREAYDGFAAMVAKKDKIGAGEKFMLFMKIFAGVYPKYV